MQLIYNWLKGSKNFIVGRGLYTTFGTDDGLKKLFAQGATDYNKKRLTQELEKLSQQDVKVVAKKLVPTQKSIATIEKGFDSVSDKLNKEWNGIYAELKLHQHHLDAFGEDNSEAAREACFELCKKIKQLEKQMLKVFETLDYYKEHKRLPDVVEKKIVIPTDALELGRFVENCKRQIRRLRRSENPIHAQLLIDWHHKYKLATGKEYESKN
jgi:hypothetical protein